MDGAVMDGHGKTPLVSLLITIRSQSGLVKWQYRDCLDIFPFGKTTRYTHNFIIHGAVNG